MDEDKRLVLIDGHPVQHLLAPMVYVHASQERVYGASALLAEVYE